MTEAWKKLILKNRTTLLAPAPILLSFPTGKLPEMLCFLNSTGVTLCDAASDPVALGQGDSTTEMRTQSIITSCSRNARTTVHPGRYLPGPFERIKYRPPATILRATQIFLSENTFPNYRDHN